EGSVDPAAVQRRRRALAREGHQGRVLRGDPAVAEQPHREWPNAAALLADLDPQTTKIVETAQQPGLSVEEPDRLIIEAPERAQSLGRQCFGGAALDEARHRLAGREPLERFDRSGAGLDLDAEAVLGG